MKKNNIKIKISAVSYLNTKPLVYGIKNKLDKNSYSLSLDTPSGCAEKLLSGKADLGLVPVAIIPEMKKYFFISDYCIGAVGAVGSVMLYSDAPLKKIEKILLDYQSRTSVLLVQLLSEKFWKIKPEWIKARKGFEKKIKSTTAAVIIGDRTFQLRGKYKYAYDLSQEWYQFTHLPFVFACWVSSKKLSSAFINDFNKALEYGLDNRAKLIEGLKKTNRYSFDLKKYLMTNINYDFDKSKKRGMEKFLLYAKELSAVY